MENDDTLSQYVIACQTVANEYIGHSTRFGAAELTVLEASPQIRNFNINVHHSLKVISDKKDVQGIVKPGDGDVSIDDSALYQGLVEKQALSELDRKATLEDLVASVKSHPYATVSDRTRIRSHPQRLFHSYECGTCHGSGQITCHGCAGSGKVSCNHCGGSGKVNCPQCFGSGKLSSYVYDNTTNRAETRYRPCFNCSGGRVTCSSCGGGGWITCGTCRGSGSVICGTCAGHGCFTRITSTHTDTVPTFSGRYPEGTPNYVNEAICKAGFPNLEKYGVIEFDSVDIDHVQVRADFTYRAIMPFCELHLAIHGQRSAWVLYGRPPQIHDTGGILEVLLKDDFTRLDALGTGWSRMLPWFHRQAREAMTPFMESEVHQAIIIADHEGLATSAIREKVNRSLSEEYIERTLSKLRKSIQTAATWSSLKWIFGTALSSIPLIVSAITFMERPNVHAMFATQDHLLLFPWGAAPQTLLVMAIMTIPISFTGWLLAKWISKRWIRRAGGKHLVNWASRKGLLMGRWTAVAVMVSTTIVAATFFNKWPVWMDREGKLYGTAAVFQPPLLINPPVFRPMGAIKPRGSYNPKRKY